MKTIGLLGGMSWESTSDYYRGINKGVNKSLGGLHSAKIVLYSVDFDPIEKLMSKEEWEDIGNNLTKAAQKIQAAGADFLLICTNTMHKVAPQIENAINIPLIHIADATAEVLVRNNIRKVGLLGTAFTMEHDFYKGKLSRSYDLSVVVPNKSDRKIIHDIIFKELCSGRVVEKSKVEYLRILDDLVDKGAESVILGCTEIGMLVKQSDTSVELFDTTAIHVEKAVDYAISQEDRIIK